MACNYYLMTGARGKGKVLNLEVNDSIVKAFTDISDIDLLTMHINRNDIHDVLREHNASVDKNDMIYIAYGSPDTKNIRTYAPIFKCNNEKANTYLDKFMHFALQRSEKVENKQSIESVDIDRPFEEYIRRILFNILNNGKKDQILDYDSLLNYKLKEDLKERYNTAFDKNIGNFMNYLIYRDRNILSKYMELRNLTIEYLLYLDKEERCLRTKLKNRTTWLIEGMEDSVIIPSATGNDTILEYHQMDFNEYLLSKKI